MAAVVRCIAGVCGGELGFPCSIDVSKGPNGWCSSAGSCVSSGTDAMAEFFMFSRTSVLIVEVDSRERYRSFTLKVFPAAI